VVQNQGSALSYRSGRPVEVPSDNAPRKLPIAVLDLKAELDHVVAPRTSTDVLTRAIVTNTTELTLLAGSAAVFRAEEFVGRTTLELIAPGEEFELQLGVEDRIRVDRELISRVVGKNMLGSTGRDRAGYRTTVTNLLPRPARVTVIDQIPVARHPDIKIRMDQVEPKPAEWDEVGILRWRLEIPPFATAELHFTFTVEAPKGKPIHGLTI
jgi:uncharacterized protein (TIGR02231 family)